MDSKKASFSSIDEYIAAFPEDIQAILQAIRATIHAAAPDATEKISYAMPTFYLEGNLVYFGAFKNHIGFYPVPSAIKAFAEELAPYKRSTGGIQFSLEEPMPLDLIRRMTEFRVIENIEKAALKASQKKKK